MKGVPVNRFKSWFEYKIILDRRTRLDWKIHKLNYESTLHIQYIILHGRPNPVRGNAGYDVVPCQRRTAQFPTACCHDRLGRSGRPTWPWFEAKKMSEERTEYITWHVRGNRRNICKWKMKVNRTSCTMGYNFLRMCLLLELLIPVNVSHEKQSMGVVETSWREFDLVEKLH